MSDVEMFRANMLYSGCHHNYLEKTTAFIMLTTMCLHIDFHYSPTDYIISTDASLYNNPNTIYQHFSAIITSTIYMIKIKP